LKYIFTFIFSLFAFFAYTQTGKLDGEIYTGTKAFWNKTYITYRFEIKVGNPQTGKISTCYKDINFINPDSKRDYKNDYFLLWETTKNIILPYYQLYILDGGKWRLYSEIAQKI